MCAFLAVLGSACAETGGSSALGSGSRTASGMSATGEPLRPTDDAPPSVVGAWVSQIGWGAGEAESGPGSIKTTHRFSSSLSTGGVSGRGVLREMGVYEIEEEARDVPSRGCHHTTIRRGTFELDSRILTVTLTEGQSIRTCPKTKAVTHVMKDQEVVQTYEAQLNGDTLTLRSILAGATLSPIVFRRDGQ